MIEITPIEFPPTISVVIVHWINIDDTIECLESLSEIKYPQISIILVSNGSPDIDVSRINKVFPGVQIIISRENLGFSGGNNLGIKKAIADGSDFIFLLNNDTVVSPNLFNYLIPALNDPEVGIVGPVISNYYQPNRVWFAGGSYSRYVGFSYRQRPLAPFENNKAVDWINGCAMLIKREIFDLIGTFWEPYYFLVEDLDFCLRASRENIKCVQVGQPLVRHKISASGGIPGTDLFSPDKAYYYARNFIHLIRRDARGFWRVMSILCQFFVVLPFWFVYSLIRGNLGFLPHYLIGLWDGFFGRTGKRNL